MFSVILRPHKDSLAIACMAEMSLGQLRPTGDILPALRPVWEGSWGSDDFLVGRAPSWSWMTAALAQTQGNSGQIQASPLFSQL